MIKAKDSRSFNQDWVSYWIVTCRLPELLQLGEKTSSRTKRKEYQKTKNKQTNKQTNKRHRNQIYLPVLRMRGAVGSVRSV